MSHLAVALLLLSVPVEAERILEVPPEAIVQAMPIDLCAAAKEIAAQRPCLRPEDCGAFQDWKQLFGAPRTEPLSPEIVGRSIAGALVQLEAQAGVRQAPRAYHCLAAEKSLFEGGKASIYRHTR